ncbi:MAG: UDP-glucose 4-epimerase GalE [Planctomycetota bacterium]|nr:MAG: UDP-glucose 4-epimerase GalE [Planctomycetota bacterium]
MILVTGGAGYIGSYAVRCLRARGDEVVVLDDLSSGHREAVGDAELVVADVCDRDAVRDVFAKYPIESVCHFANLILIDESVREPEKYFKVNVSGGVNLLAAMRKHGIKNFIFSSSAAVYGSPESQPISESAPLRPINPYGLTKVVFETTIEYACRHWGLRAAALRYFNAAGAAPDGSIGERHEPESHVIPIALEVAAGKHESLHVFGSDYPTPDGTCRREFVHVDDIAEAHVLALDALKTRGGFRAYNIGAGIVLSVREVIKAVESVTGKLLPVEDSPRRPGDPPMLEADSTRIRKELGWESAFTDFSKIVETAWRWSQEPKF